MEKFENIGFSTVNECLMKHPIPAFVCPAIMPLFSEDNLKCLTWKGVFLKTLYLLPQYIDQSVLNSWLFKIDVAI